jgi:hypothetical protein
MLLCGLLRLINRHLSLLLMQKPSGLVPERRIRDRSAPMLEVWMREHRHRMMVWAVRSNPGRGRDGRPQCLGVHLQSFLNVSAETNFQLISL